MFGSDSVVFGCVSGGVSGVTGTATGIFLSFSLNGFNDFILSIVPFTDGIFNPSITLDVSLDSGGASIISLSVSAIVAYVNTSVVTPINT